MSLTSPYDYGKSTNSGVSLINDFDIELKAERSKLQETVAYLQSMSGKLSELQIFRLLVPVQVFEPEVKPRQPNTFNFFEKERAIKRRKQTISKCISI
ncbi:hypothetical protein BD770DRAFT_393802 [Pilaira anomala]|nr:hypothetical protein BD770DRAFT_393802 [Pilaira anomala]